MSFTSLQKRAKNFKPFSSFDETIITGALSCTSLTEENLNELTNLTTQMITFCKENKCIPDNTAKLESETGRRTKTELFQLFISKFKKNLLSYEHQETLDKFEVNVPEYLSFHNKLRSSFNVGEFESYLTTVNNMEGKLNRLYLLTISDRGYIWEKVKQNHQENNKDIPWTKLLNNKGYSYSTIQSYINFSQACESYPRILVSTDYYSEWKKFLTMFLAEVQKDSQLQSRCMTELQFS